MPTQAAWPMDQALLELRVPMLSLESLAVVPGLSVPLCASQAHDQLAITAAMAGDRLLGIAVLDPDANSAGAARTGNVHAPVCLARVEWHSPRAGEGVLIVVRGLLRGRISEVTTGRSGCRWARLRLRAERCSAEPLIDRERRRFELLDLYGAISRDASASELDDADLPLGQLCDVIAASVASRHDLGEPLRVFGEIDVDQRSDLLLDLLRSMVRDRREIAGIGIAFSEN